jgi:WD40 repeat protein
VEVTEEMKKISVIIVLLNLIMLGQENQVEKGFSNYLYYSHDSNILISLFSETHYGKNFGNSYQKYKILFLSNFDGSLLKEVSLPDDDKQIVAFNVSHDGLSFVIISSKSNYFNGVGEEFIIRKYSINENRWIWDRIIQISEPLRLTYSSDNKELICVTVDGTIFFDSNSGDINRVKDSIASIINYKNEFSKFELSKYGRYFVYWDCKYLRNTRYDDGGILKLLDIGWYGLKWLFYFGNIPNYFYVWDVFEDKLIDKIEIPYEIERFAPAITANEKILLMRSFNNVLQTYSVQNKNIIKEFYRSELEDENEPMSGEEDYTIISPDTGYFAYCPNFYNIFIIEYSSGSIIKKIDKTSYINYPYNRYAMVFSSDSKYFAVVSRKNKIEVFDTKTWRKKWERDRYFK